MVVWNSLSPCRNSLHPPRPSGFVLTFTPLLSPKNPHRESASVGRLCGDYLGDDPKQAGGGAGALRGRGELKPPLAPRHHREAFYSFYGKFGVNLSDQSSDIFFFLCVWKGWFSDFKSMMALKMHLPRNETKGQLSWRVPRKVCDYYV